MEDRILSFGETKLEHLYLTFAQLYYSSQKEALELSV